MLYDSPHIISPHELFLIRLVLVVPRRVRRQLEGGGVIEHAETQAFPHVLDRPGSERLVEARGVTELKNRRGWLSVQRPGWRGCSAPLGNTPCPKNR